MLADVVNRQCLQMSEGTELFKERFLHNPRVLDCAPHVSRSVTAVIACGLVHRGDIVWCRTARCGRIQCFYEVEGEIFASVALFGNVANDPSMLDESQCTTAFIDVRAIVDACTWYYTALAR